AAAPRRPGDAAGVDRAAGRARGGGGGLPRGARRRGADGRAPLRAGAGAAAEHAPAPPGQRADAPGRARRGPPGDRRRGGRARPAGPGAAVDGAAPGGRRRGADRAPAPADDAGGRGRAMAEADWPWLLPVTVLMPLWYVTSTVTFRAATPLRPPFGLTYLTQLAAAALNRVTPNNVGGLGTNIRFLQRSGYGATDAATTMALGARANGIAGAAIIVVFVTWAGRSDARLPWPGRSELLVVAGVALGLVGLVVAVPALRRLIGGRAAPVVRRAWSSLAELATDPRRGVTMLVSSVA